MALRDKLRSRSQPFLEPGEQLRHVWLGQTGVTPYMLFAAVVPGILVGTVLRGGIALAALAGAVVGGVFALFIQPKVICVTDRAVVVLQSSRWLPASPRQVVQRLPRSTLFGRMRGMWGQTNATGEKLYVHMRFHKDVAAADAELVAYQPAPASHAPTVAPGWYPDPGQSGRQRWFDGTNWTSHLS